LITSRKFQAVSFWQKCSGFHNPYKHPIHITDFPSLFFPCLFCPFIMLYFSPQWLPVRLYFCYIVGFSDLNVIHAQVSVKVFGAFLKHLICAIFHFIVFKIILFFLLRFPLSNPVPFSASIDIYFLQLLICLCILIFQIFYSIFCHFDSLIYFFCNGSTRLTKIIVAEIKLMRQKPCVWDHECCALIERSFLEKSTLDLYVCWGGNLIAWNKARIFQFEAISS
jgi:hypothetical protein